MHRLPILLLASALLPAGAALAADGPAQTHSAEPTQRRLSDAEIEKILDQAARRREAAPLAIEPIDPDEGKVGTPVHGEVGFAIGTGGYRSAYGTAVVPLSDDGFAAFSFETNRFRPRDFRYYDDYAR